MTDEAKELVQRLRGYTCLHGNKQVICEEAADLIETQAREIERLRKALTQIARLRTDLRGDFSLGSKQSDIARAALAGDSHD